jgi:hypothetical protein
MPVPGNIAHVPHKLKLTGKGASAWGECLCGYWCSGGGLTLKSTRVAIREDFDRHLAAMERLARISAQGESMRLFEPAPTQITGQMSL